MKYVLHAYDHIDSEAYERRMQARPAHFERARKLKADGNFILGGALLDPAGTMIGSMMLVDFETEDQLHEWLESDPYVTGKVWNTLDVKPFRQADI
ncbi:YciI family protein [Arundinibacter roseus]|uniref:YCII-related domain-containing protein n=1 Tax=Arundinibacter roseus TaxID=2070510 RepID=A0A4R4KLY9_9BACT|nr:YciI family protein [Arundinibacter roseus]TDB68006.1 hypothetical protein EZE20_03525 [Arundinibacter roseus]